jgi:hypothetical protein
VFLVAIIALSLIAVPITGGRLSRLADLSLRGKPMIVSALAIQVVIVSVIPTGDPWLHRALHLGSYALAGAFLVANRHTPGFRLIGCGALLNAIAIFANNGVMPASSAALRTAGQLSSTKDFVNSGLVAHPRLLFLGDIFAIPRSWPLHNVFSVGDVCIAVGAAIAIHVVCRGWALRCRDADSRRDGKLDRDRICDGVAPGA